MTTALDRLVAAHGPLAPGEIPPIADRLHRADEVQAMFVQVISDRAFAKRCESIAGLKTERSGNRRLFGPAACWALVVQDRYLRRGALLTDFRGLWSVAQQVTASGGAMPAEPPSLPSTGEMVPAAPAMPTAPTPQPVEAITTTTIDTGLHDLLAALLQGQATLQEQLTSQVRELQQLRKAIHRQPSELLAFLNHHADCASRLRPADLKRLFGDTTAMAEAGRHDGGVFAVYPGYLAKCSIDAKGHRTWTILRSRDSLQPPRMGFGITTSTAITPEVVQMRSIQLPQYIR